VMRDALENKKQTAQYTIRDKLPAGHICGWG